MPRGEASSAGQLTAWPVAFLLLLVAALEWSPGRVTELDAARVQVSLLVASGGPHTIGTPSATLLARLRVLGPWLLAGWALGVMITLLIARRRTGPAEDVEISIWTGDDRPTTLRPMAQHGTPRLVLLATDDSDTHESLESLLIDAGYRVLPARDGFEAFALAQRGAPDIILVDADMPCLDGAEFCRAYRWRGGTTPVVLLSAAHHDVIAVTIAACGASAYIPKPFDVGRVLETVADLVDGR